MPKSDPGPASSRVGLVGLGTMGAPMARRMVKAGYSLALYDIDAALTRRLADELGATASSSLADLGASCGIVITMLPNAGIVRAAVLGDEPDAGIAARPVDGAIIIDMSSSYPPATVALGAELAERGVMLLDAPVSGGVQKAISGELAIMLGGDDEAAMDRAGDVLASMGTVYRTGGLGSGHASKALNNYVSAAGLAAACEAVIVGKAFGLDPERLTEVINASTGRNNSTEKKLKPFILSGDFAKAGFALELMAKDVKAAADLAEELGLSLPGIADARSLWRDASHALGKGADHTEIYRFLMGDGGGKPE
ncbi:MAG: NAD(P)-dependent oxidoreductase [Rhodomicrobiaceae bacterium]